MELEELFEKWNEYNNKIGGSLGSFDFSSVREIRDKQVEIEDKIYEILLEHAPGKIKKILPEGCGDMEVGYETRKKKFYFVMEDPEYVESEEVKLIAIIMDSNKNVEMELDFTIED
ncbi:MAG: hypothetical protein EU544_00185 [Promethearchaeota archaeon]|nr:MAG: hypothetical protein EU544_00185 [Candidatus Lokiarchaeota archaeon]